MRSRLLAPDTLLGEQFARVFSGAHDLPEKRLFIAVLMNAVSDFQDAVRSPERYDEWTFQEIRAWFFKSDRHWLFSFENLCEQLDLDANCIRGQLRSLLHQRRRRPKAVARA